MYVCVYIYEFFSSTQRFNSTTLFSYLFLRGQRENQSVCAKEGRASSVVHPVSENFGQFQLTAAVGQLEVKLEGEGGREGAPSEGV